MADQNSIADQWRGLNFQERDEALSRMTPDQKMRLAASLGYKEGGTPGTSAIHPEARTVGNYLSETARGVGRGLKDDVVGLYDTVRHPIDTATGLVRQTGQAASDAAKEFRETAPAPLYQRGVAAALTGLENAPMVGGMVQHAEQGGGRMASPESVGAATEGIMAFAAPELVGRAIPRVVDIAKEKAANFASAPRTVGELVRKTKDANIDIRNANEKATTEHRDEAAEAAHETQGREASARHEAAGKAEDIRIKEAADAERLRLAHEKEVADVRQHNEQVKTKHAAVYKRIQEENAAQENVAQLRQQKEGVLKQATDEYRAQEEKTDQAAKATENQAWTAWRGKVKGATIDGAEITGPLKKLRLDSPEVDRTLRQLEPSGDEVPQESPYARLRDETARSNFQGNYADLSPVKRDAVDAMMVRAGETPEPVELNPEEGQPISIERVQRANSILQRYIRSGRFEGPLLGEMKQVAKVLRRAVAEGSEAHGALDDLDRARAETVRYQEAFGRERPEPKTVRGERERAANPEEVKRLQEEERLEAAAKYDPSLADAQRKVKAAREEVKKLPSEDQLRKGLKQIPASPSVDHPYEAYRLKREPKAPPKRLTSGSAEERAAQAVKPPERVLPSDRPIETPEKKVNVGDIVAEKQRPLTQAANRVRHWGAYLGFVWPAIEVIRGATRGELPNIGSTAASMIATPLAADAIARIIESPKMQRILTRATPKDIAQIPADLRGDLPAIVETAQKRGIIVSPALLAATTGAALAGQRKPVAAALSANQ